MITQKTQKTQIDYHSELMKNYVSHTPIKGGNEFKALLDHKNQPLLFSIGSDNRLRLIHQNSNKSAPWSLIQLEKENKAITATCFDVAQNRTGDIRIAYACIEDDKPKIFYTELSSNNFNKHNATANFEWSEHKVENSINEVNRIEIDDEYLIFSTKTTDQEAHYYYAQYGDDNTKLSLPELGYEIINFKVGSFTKKKGVFLLYNIGKNQNLIFQSFPDPILGKTTKIPFKFEGFLENIDIIRKKDGRDHLLACGDNVYLYKSKNERELLIKNRNSKFIDIKATNFDGVSSAWIVEKTQNDDYNLLFLTDYFYDEDIHKFVKEKWTSDLLMKTNVRQFTCLKGSSADNHLLLINKENELSHFWQDSKTSLWKEDSIAVEPLDDADAIIEFPCYTATIKLKNKDTFTPIVEQEIKVSSSSNAFVTINGLSYLLTPDKTKTVKTDAMGNITFIYPVQDEINTPLFYIEHDDLEKKQIINPSHKLEERLELIKSDKEFIAARTDDGKPLWKTGESPENSDLNNGAQAIQQLLESKKQFLLGEESGVKSNLPNRNIMWGVKFTENGNLQYLEGNNATTHFNTLMNSNDDDSPILLVGWNPFKAIGHAIGSIFHWISGAIGTIRSFILNVIDGITTVILDIAGTIFKFVIDVIEKVFPFVQIILDALLVVFKTVMKWIGKLIGWDDIWETHKVIAKMLENGMKSNTENAINKIDYWRKNADSFFDSLKDNFHNIGLDEVPLVDIKQDQKNVYSSPENKALNSPEANWAMYQMQHGGIMIDTEIMGNNGGDPFNQFINSISNQFSFLEKEIGAIIDFILHPDFSLHGLIKLLTPIFDNVIDSLKSFIDGVLDFIIKFMQEIEQMLTQKVKIPFLSSFYEFMTNLLGEGEELTFINAVSLLVAIPYTTTLKLTGQGAPFKDGRHGMDEKELFDRLLNVDLIQTSLNMPNQQKNSLDEEISRYSNIGGTIGATAGIVGAVTGFFAFADKSTSKKLKYWNVGFGLLSQICTIPIPVDDSTKAETSESIRMTQFLMTYINTITSPMIKNEMTANFIGATVSIFSLGLNIASNVVKDPGAASWVIHMGSRTGSIVSGCAKIAEQPEFVVAGQGISFSASLSSFIRTIATDEKILNHGVLVG